MRWLRGFALLLASVILIPRFAEAAVPSEQVVSGRLVFENGHSCDHIGVTLESMGIQSVIDLTSTAIDCSFRFPTVPPGTYYIHIKAEGFDEVFQRVDVTDLKGGIEVSIPMTRSAANVVNHSSFSSDDPDPDVIDASQFPDRYPKQAVSLYKKAANNREKGKTAEAISELEDAIKIAPAFYLAHNDLGILYRMAGRFDDAEAQFLSAHQLNENASAPLINLGSLYIYEQKEDRAIEVSEKAVRANSGSAPAFFNLGLALYKTSMLDRAEVALKRALYLAPRMLQIRLALANVYLKQHRFDRVVDQLNAYLAADPPKGAERDHVEHLKGQLIKSGDGGS